MRKTTIIFAVLAGIFACGAGGGTWYAFSSIYEMRGTLETGRLELAKEEGRAKTALEVKRQLERLKSERAELGQYFFKEEDIVRLLEQLEGLAQHADIDMTVSAASPADGPGQKIFRTTMKIEGSWQNTMYFIHLLESLPFRLEVTKVNLSGGESGERWNGEVTLDLLSFVPKTKSQ